MPGPGAVDAGFLTAVGVRTDLRVDGPADAADLLDRLGDRARVVPAGGVLAAHSALAAAVDARRLAVADVEPPARVRTAAGRVADADPDHGAAPTVLDRPWLLAGLDPDGVVPVAPGGASTLADLLDLPTAAADHHGEIRSPGIAAAWTDLPVAAAWAAAVGRALPAGEVVVHERLRVTVADDDRTGPPREVFPGVWVDAARCTPTTRSAGCSPRGRWPARPGASGPQSFCAPREPRALARRCRPRTPSPTAPRPDPDHARPQPRVDRPRPGQRQHPEHHERGQPERRPDQHGRHRVGEPARQRRGLPAGVGVGLGRRHAATLVAPRVGRRPGGAAVRCERDRSERALRLTARGGASDRCARWVTQESR